MIHQIMMFCLFFDYTDAFCKLILGIGKPLTKLFVYIDLTKPAFYPSIVNKHQTLSLIKFDIQCIR